MTHIVKIIYSIEGTTHTDVLESQTRPSIQVNWGTRTGIVKLNDDAHVLIYSEVWKIERITG